MKIQWLGHACFLIAASDGHKLLTDPFDARLGYPVPKARTDIVTMSHGHFDHNYVAELPLGFIQLNQAGEYRGYGFSTRTVDSWHDDAKGTKRGANLIFVIESDGIKIVHLGDLGEVPTQKQLDQVGGNVDVLLVPVGGFYTLNADQAAETVQLIGPRVSIPMHYRNNWWNDEKIATEKLFAALMNSEYMHTNSIEFTKETLGNLPGSIVLAYP